MDAARWERIQALFHASLDAPEIERREFVETASAGDQDLAARVLALLEEDARTHAFVDRDLSKVARDVLEDRLPPQRAVGPYVLRSFLGEGGMGVVYLAERADIGSRVAIKMLRDAALSPARRERFASEERALAQLNHPAIARLYDADVLADGTPYFVMEYVEGEPLTTYCAQNNCSLDERLRLFRAVCEGVRHAHSHAIIHRDLKPSNILVTREGGVKLLDFGIAKQLENLESPAHPTQTVFRLMTPAYAAPEQVRGEVVGTYTDVYALGVVLYELLTGQLPYDLSRKTPGQIEMAILQNQPEPPSAVVRRTTTPHRAAASAGRAAWADLDVLCLTAMQKDPARRYATVDALVRDVDRYTRGEPLEARPDSLAYRAGKFLRRNRRPVVATLAVALLMVALVAFYTIRLAEQRNRAQVEAAKATLVSEYLIGLFEAGNPFGQDADTLTVRTLMERGVERAESLGDQPDVQAQMLDVLGRVYSMLSEYERARPLLHRALALRRAGAGNALDLAESLAALGILYRYTSHYDSAEVALRESLVLREHGLAEDAPEIATTLDELAVAINSQGRYQEAEALYRRALEIRRRIYDRPDVLLATSLNNLAVNLANQGDFASSEALFREALGVSTAALGPDHPSRAMDLANLGVVLEAREAYAEADSVLTEALRIRRLRLGNDHAETAFNLSQLAGVQMRSGHPDRAEGSLREAMAIENRILEPNHRNAAITRVRLGVLLLERGDLAGADSLLRRAVEILKVSVGERHEFTATTQCHLATVQARRQLLAEAEAIYRSCTAVLGEDLPEDHDTLIRFRSMLGLVLARQGRYPEAEPLLVHSYEQMRKLFGPGHRDAREAAERAAELYASWNKPEQAERYRHLSITSGNETLSR